MNEATRCEAARLSLGGYVIDSRNERDAGLGRNLRKTRRTTRQRRALELKRVACMALISLISVSGQPFALPSETPGSGALADGAEVTVSVRCAETGTLRVDLVDEASFGDPDRPLQRREETIGQDDVSRPITVSFSGLKAGRYALRAFIDRNGDGRLNVGPFGPTEPWALSWAAAEKRGVPRFEDVAFQVYSGMNSISMEAKK